MRSQRFFKSPGQSFVAISMPSGMIRGIEIDNSSGSWLYIPSLETYIPPFTIGWSMPIAYGATSIDIKAGQSPAGQVSTSQGDGVTVFLSDDIVAVAGGSPNSGDSFINGFTPLLQSFVSHGYTRGDAPGSTTIVTNLTGGTKRLRIHHAILQAVSVADPAPCFTPISGFVGPTVGGQGFSYMLRIAGSKIRDEIVFDPLDCDVGTEMQLTIGNPTAAFLDPSFGTAGGMLVNLNAFYELI